MQAAPRHAGPCLWCERSMCRQALPRRDKPTQSIALECEVYGGVLE
jgi:hypothetical protein